MKLLAVHPVLWSSLLVLCASQSETVCRDQKHTDDIFPVSPPNQNHVEREKVKDFSCLLYPSNLLNCSWSFLGLQDDARLFVNISICDGNNEVYYEDLSSEERVGWRSLTLRGHKDLYLLYLVLQFNISLHDEWTVYSAPYDLVTLEVLPPPSNVSASVRDGDLVVTWDPPLGRFIEEDDCFKYELDLGDQEQVKQVSELLTFTEPQVDPTATFRVRMRTRKDTPYCTGSAEWSEWSHTVTVEQSVNKEPITLVIVAISLGIPMILLALMLLVRHQRVTKVLFPPIPRPPSKYKDFLEENDTSSVFRPVAAAEEEITEVEDTEEKPQKQK